MNISIFGLGYVGCVSLGCLAKNGHNLIGVDVNDNKINQINSGKPTIIEKGIKDIIMEAFDMGRICATRDCDFAIRSSEISIICVGTPSSSNGHLNLNYIFKVASEIGESLIKKDDFHVVVVRSTVLPGTNQKIGEIIEQKSGKERNVDFAVVSNPEFLREGTAVYDYYNPSFTVIGSDNEAAIAKVSSLYRELDAPIEVTDVEIAEIIKYVSNSFHALKVVFGNEVGNICKKIGIDSHKVMKLFCKDRQLNISPYYLMPGFAYGGSCLPKDLKGLRTIAHDNYLEVPVLSSIERSNALQIDHAYTMITEKGSRKVGVLGLSFKAGTDDLRLSPAVELVEKLIGKGFTVKIHDENVNMAKITGTNKDFIEKRIPHLSEIITGNFEQVINASEVVVITQKRDIYADIWERHSDKCFIDLVRISENHRNKNLEGICW
ncbi:MAG: nucleotide sugar dehydrogenase [Cytophagales bacterium]|nr:nucleotide sugar dehydrogenase [Cytophagales bacterium]